MAISNKGGHGVTDQAGQHNMEATAAQPNFTHGPQADLSNSAGVSTPAARPQKKTGFPPASGNAGAAQAQAGPGPVATSPVASAPAL